MPDWRGTERVKGAHTDGEFTHSVDKAWSCDEHIAQAL